MTTARTFGSALISSIASVQALVSSAVIALRSLGSESVSKRTPGAGLAFRTGPEFLAAMYLPA